jgi:mercuric ion binding protein
MLNKTKNIAKALLTVLIAVTFIACSKSDNKVSENKDNTQTNEVSETQDNGNTKTSEVKTTANDEKATIQLPTIQCNTCKKNITKAMKKVDGVNDFNIDVDGKVMTVAYDKSKTDLSKVENAITAAGYDANDKKADPVAYDKLDECCKVPGKK